MGLYNRSESWEVDKFYYIWFRHEKQTKPVTDLTYMGRRIRDKNICTAAIRDWSSGPWRSHWGLGAVVGNFEKQKRLIPLATKWLVHTTQSPKGVHSLVPQSDIHISHLCHESCFFYPNALHCFFLVYSSFEILLSFQLHHLSRLFMSSSCLQSSGPVLATLPADGLGWQWAPPLLDSQWTL